jgi:DNA polymerase III delta subunit
VPRKLFSEGEVPSFPEAPSVILITGDVEFFVEEAAAKAAARLASEDAEVLRFEEEAPVEAVSDALRNRSLFSARRVVQFDVSRLLGTETPAKLVDEAVEGWERGTPSGRRDAFRRVRALISALDLPASASSEELAEDAARKTRRKAQQDVLLSILRELPEEKGSPKILNDAVRFLLERGNEGTVALVTATAPPAGMDLLEEIAKKGLVLEAFVGKGAASALTRLARTLAKEREVSLEPPAIDRLLLQTDSNPELFSSELQKLLQWAGPGGSVRAADVRENVEDDASEDIYAFYDAIGRREAGEALSRLDRLFSDRSVRSGDRRMEEKDREEAWPFIFLGLLTGEVRRMLLIRSRMEEFGGGPDVSQNYNAFQTRVVPRLAEPVASFGRSPFENKNGAISGFLWFKAAARAARYSTPELARALARAADVDVRLKSSVEPLDALSVYVAELIAGS